MTANADPANASYPLPPRQDTPYLRPLIEEIEQEERERREWDTIAIKKVSGSGH